MKARPTISALGVVSRHLPPNQPSTYNCSGAVSLSRDCTKPFQLIGVSMRDLRRVSFVSVILMVTAVLGAACGGGQEPTATSTPPLSDSGGVTVEIASVGEEQNFDKARLVVGAGDEVVLRFENVSKTLQHNWVLVRPDSKDTVAIAGLKAGPGNGWIPQGDDRVIAYTGLLDPGDTQVIRFPAPALGTYQFVCTYPGHSATMFGSFDVTP